MVNRELQGSDDAEGYGVDDQALVMEGANNTIFEEAALDSIPSHPAPGSESHHPPGDSGNSTIIPTVEKKEQKSPAKKKSRKKRPNNPYISTKKQREMRKKRRERYLKQGAAPKQVSAFQEDFGSLVMGEADPVNHQVDMAEIISFADILLAAAVGESPVDGENQKEVESIDQGHSQIDGDGLAQPPLVQLPVQAETETGIAPDATLLLQDFTETIQVDEATEMPPSEQDTTKVTQIVDGRYVQTTVNKQSLRRPYNGDAIQATNSQDFTETIQVDEATEMPPSEQDTTKATQIVDGRYVQTTVNKQSLRRPYNGDAIQATNSQDFTETIQVDEATETPPSEQDTTKVTQIVDGRYVQTTVNKQSLRRPYNGDAIQATNSQDFTETIQVDEATETPPSEQDTTKATQIVDGRYVQTTVNKQSLSRPYDGKDTIQATNIEPSSLEIMDTMTSRPLEGEAGSTVVDGQPLAIVESGVHVARTENSGERVQNRVSRRSRPYNGRGTIQATNTGPSSFGIMNTMTSQPLRDEAGSTVVDELPLAIDENEVHAVRSENGGERLQAMLTMQSRPYNARDTITQVVGGLFAHTTASRQSLSRANNGRDTTQATATEPRSVDIMDAMTSRPLEGEAGSTIVDEQPLAIVESEAHVARTENSGERVQNRVTRRSRPYNGRGTIQATNTEPRCLDTMDTMTSQPLEGEAGSTVVDEQLLATVENDVHAIRTDNGGERVQNRVARRSRPYHGRGTIQATNTGLSSFGIMDTMTSWPLRGEAGSTVVGAQLLAIDENEVHAVRADNGGERVPNRVARRRRPYNGRGTIQATNTGPSSFGIMNTMTSRPLRDEAGSTVVDEQPSAIDENEVHAVRSENGGERLQAMLTMQNRPYNARDTITQAVGGFAQTTAARQTLSRANSGRDTTQATATEARSLEIVDTMTSRPFEDEVGSTAVDEQPLAIDENAVHAVSSENGAERVPVGGGSKAYYNAQGNIGLDAAAILEGTAGAAVEAAAPRGKKRGISALSSAVGSSITTSPCQVCGVTLAEILRHQKRSVAALGMSPEEFMETHTTLCFLHREELQSSGGSGSGDGDTPRGDPGASHQGEQGDGGISDAESQGGSGGTSSASLSEGEAAEGGAVVGLWGQNIQLPGADAGAGLEETWQALSDFLALRHGQRSGQVEDAEPGQPPEARTLRDYLNTSIPPISEFQARLRAAESEAERFSIQESIVKTLNDLQVEYFLIDDVVKCLEAEAGTAEPETSGGARKRRKTHGRNPFEPEDSVTWEDKKEAALYGFTYNPAASKRGNQAPRRRRRAIRGRRGRLIPDELPLVPGYEYIPPGGLPQPKTTRSRKPTTEKVGGVAPAEGAGGGASAVVSGACSEPPPNSAPAPLRKSSRLLRSATPGPSTSQLPAEPVVPSEGGASEPATEAPRRVFSVTFSGAHLGVFREVVSREPNPAPAPGEGASDGGRGLLPGGAQTEHKPRARGRTYKTPYSVIVTEPPKPTREEEFLAAQNGNLGKRKRVKTAPAYEAPPPRKRKKAAAAGAKD